MGKELYRFINHKNRNIDVIFIDIPGKRFSTGTKDLSEAVAYAEEFLKKNGIAKGKIPTFKDFSKDFYKRTDPDSQRQRDKDFRRVKQEETYRQKQSHINDFMNPYFGAYLITAISPPMLERWLVSFKGIYKDDVSAKYRNIIFDTLSEVMDDAVRQGWITLNPCKQVRKIAVRQEDRVNKREALTLYQQKILFPDDPLERVIIWESLQWATLFSVMYDTGFRPGEVLGLRVCDIYKTPKGYAVFTEQTLNTKEGIIKQRVKTSGKGMESRVGLLTDTTGQLVLKLINDIKDNEEQLFFRYKGKRDSYIRATASNYQFVKIMKKYGFDEITTQYCLRHTYATYRRGDMDDNALALAMGHKNGVLQDYDHRKATILIKQLEENRDEIFKPMDDNKEEEIVPLKKRG